MDIKNWRPITICSVLRRVIERVLDRRLREFVNFNPNQRGFNKTSGTHINTALLDCILHEAKVNKTTVAIVFLDIKKAFDNIGHDHLSKTLMALPLPTKLRNLIINLQLNNTTQITSQGCKTKPIILARGVMQGSPLSPALFNLTIDHILNDLCEHHITTTYGFQLLPDQNPLTVMGFADDIVIIGKNIESAVLLANSAIQQFNEIGLEINMDKSQGICINNGRLTEQNFIFSPEKIIPCLKKGEIIRYLGVNFSDEINFNSAIALNTLKTSLELLISSPLLQADQKFVILNTSICPSLIYPFQTVPTHKIPTKFITDADTMVRGALKELLQLPADIPNDMLYADTKFKGLGRFCSK